MFHSEDIDIIYYDDANNYRNPLIALVRAYILPYRVYPAHFPFFDKRLNVK